MTCLTVAPINTFQFAWDSASGVINDGQPVLLNIANASQEAALLTAIHREWLALPRWEEPAPIDPAAPSDLRKEMEIPVGWEGITMAAVSEDGVKFDGMGWLIFRGYIEYTDLEREATYRSGFAFAYEQEKLDKRGLIVAPLKSRHWYYERV